MELQEASQEVRHWLMPVVERHMQQQAAALAELLRIAYLAWLLRLESFEEYKAALVEAFDNVTLQQLLYQQPRRGHSRLIAPRSLNILTSCTQVTRCTVSSPATPTTAPSRTPCRKMRAMR